MIAVVAHTARAQKAHDLMSKVGAAYLTMDNGSLGCERNHHRAWTRLAEHGKGEWGVVLEDDAEPTPNFRTQLYQALAHAPGPIVSLYLGTGRPGYCQAAIRTVMQNLEGAEAKPSYLLGRTLLHAVGVAIRQDMISTVLDGISQVPYALLPIDEGIGQWAQDNGHTIAYTYPSLVNHAFGPTVTEHHDGQDRIAERRAWAVGEREWDGSTLDLQLPPVPL